VAISAGSRLRRRDAERAARLLCLAWLDAENRAGEFEPVGTHPDFRRLGLGSAVCRFALRRLEDEGATRAMVYGLVDPSNPGAKALYESIGFVETSRFLRFVRDR